MKRFLRSLIYAVCPAWEYCTREVDPLTCNVERELNALGSKGWECILSGFRRRFSEDREAEIFHGVFKRRVR